MVDPQVTAIIMVVAGVADRQTWVGEEHFYKVKVFQTSSATT